MKHFLFIIGFTILASAPLRAQFTESKERKKMWGKSMRKHKSREAFNPYLDKKTKPSQELSNQNKRDIKKMNRAAKKQKKKSMKKLGIKPTKVKRP